MAPIAFVLRLLGGGGCACGGCAEEVYWGDCCPPPCSPCDACGNYTGPTSPRASMVAGTTGGCGPNGCAMRRPASQNAWAGTTPGRHNGYNSNYAARTATQQSQNAALLSQIGAQSDPGTPPPRMLSVTEQVVVPATAARSTGSVAR